MIKNDAMQIFERYKENPIIRVSDIPYPANSVFNAAAAEVENEILMFQMFSEMHAFPTFRNIPASIMRLWTLSTGQRDQGYISDISKTLIS